MLEAAKRAENAAERAEDAGGGSSGGSGGIAKETDPTVPEWAKQPNKPTYTAEEVGAQPKGNYALKSEIPSVPVQSVNGKTGAVQLSASDVGAASKAEVERLSEEIAEQLEGKQPKGDYALKSDIPSVVPDAGFELVENVTTAEKVAAISIPVGSYKSFRLYLEVPIAEIEEAVTLRFGGATQFNTKMSKSAVTTFVAIIDIFGGYYFSDMSSAQSIYYQGSQKNWWWVVAEATNIIFSAKEFPVGTKLIAYAK